SIVATGWGVWAYLKLHRLGWYYRLETLPDPEPEKKKGGAEKRAAHDMPVPERLQVGLGQSLKVGDLEVQPTKVEKTPANDLVRSLQLRNVSANVSFAPLTEALTVYDPKGARPYTYLEAGEERLYGGRVSARPFLRVGGKGPEHVTNGLLQPG